MADITLNTLIGKRAEIVGDLKRRVVALVRRD
jgi:hypothetical protein